jgi:hypothetical protein
MSDPSESKGFKVKDRRRFDAEGNVRDDRDEPSSPPPAVASAPQPRAQPAQQAQARPGPTPSGASRPSAPRAGIGFGEFILSLGTNAAVLLGGEDPERVTSKADLGAAAQYIDIIQMLKEKTSGNLQPDEIRLIDTLLYDLQMRYLEVMKAQ